MARPLIAAMWRFTKNNGSTEDFHNLPAMLRIALQAGKMEMISRKAFGFRNHAFGGQVSITTG